MIKLFWTWEAENEELDVEIKEEEIEEEWQVALDIIENPNEFIIVAPIAWVELRDIDLSLNSNILTIIWEREKPTELYISGNISRASECFWWKFTRNIILPENLDLDDIKAILEKNILIIKIPKLKFNHQNIKIDQVNWI